MEEALTKFITAHQDDDTGRLLLNRNRYPGIDIDAAARCIEARRILRHKVPLWHAVPSLLYPGSLPLEQCSSQATALYKQQFVRPGDRIADLTGGLGIDLYFLSGKAAEAHYCERSEELVRLAQYNFHELGRTNLTVHRQETDPETLSRLPSDRFDLLYLDPARRGSGGKRVYSLTDCEPDITLLQQELLRISPRVLVKVSPMADLSSLMASLPRIREIHILSTAGECKELLLMMERQKSTEEPLITAAALDRRRYLSFHPSEEKEAVLNLVSPKEISGYLYEPDAAVLKSGAFRLLCSRYGLKKISIGTHWYIAPEKREDFPGKIHEILETLPFSREGQRTITARYPGCSVSARNYPAGADEIRKKLHLQESDENRMFVTTASDRSRIAILTRKTSC